MANSNIVEINELLAATLKQNEQLRKELKWHKQSNIECMEIIESLHIQNQLYIKKLTKLSKTKGA